MSYAENTGVPVERSKSEIETILMKYGATRFAYMTKEDGAIVAFSVANRNVRFFVPFPDKTMFSKTPTGRQRKTDAVPAAYEQEIRRRWRALSLVIKAKLEAVDSGISEFEAEFLANIVLPDGSTVGDQTRPAIEKAYSTGKNVLLLPEC